MGEVRPPGLEGEQGRRLLAEQHETEIFSLVVPLAPTMPEMLSGCFEEVWQRVWWSEGFGSLGGDVKQRHRTSATPKKRKLL